MPDFQGIKQSDKVILMKVTSRDRPDQLLETVRQYISLANNVKGMVWLFSFDEDCECSTLAFMGKLKSVFPENYQRVLIVIGSSKSKIHAINRDIKYMYDNFKHCFYGRDIVNEWDILLNISDDQRPILEGYDDIIRRTMPDDLDASLWFSDGQPRINTQEIIGRAYYERFGYIYNPEYKSLFCDNEATEVAAILGKQIKSNQQIVKHYHPAWGGSEAFKEDALYERNNNFWNEDQATFERRKKLNFGLF